MSSKVIQGRVWAILALKTIMLILGDMGQRNKNWSIFDIWYSSVCSIEQASSNGARRGLEWRAKKYWENIEKWNILQSRWQELFYLKIR